MAFENLIEALKSVNDVIRGEISSFNFHTLEKCDKEKVLKIVEYSLEWMNDNSRSTKRLCNVKKELENALLLSHLYL